MAQPGSTWGQLLNQIAADFQRLDLVSTPTPLPTDLAWIYGQQAVAYYQPKIFMASHAYLQWASTFANQNLYALPADFEDDMQILQNVHGQNVPLTKLSEVQINELDVQIPRIIGPAADYAIWGEAATLFADVTDVWQANFNYTNLVGIERILDSNGNVQKAISINGNGTSGATPPVWSTVPGASVTDGTATNGVVWQCWFNLSNPTGTVLRLFPTPDNIYPLTAVYTNKIPMPVAATTSNFWTVDAEAMIRFRAEGLLRKNVFHEQTWQLDYDTAQDEFNVLSGRVRQQSATGHARAVYL